MVEMQRVGGGGGGTWSQLYLDVSTTWVLFFWLQVREMREMIPLKMGVKCAT